MGQLNNEFPWKVNFTPSTSTQKLTLNTDNKYLDRKIEINVDAVNNETAQSICGSAIITTSLAEDGMSTYFDNGTSSNKNVTLTPKYTNTAGYKAATTTATNNGGTAYYKIKTGTLGSKGGAVSGSNVTLGTTNNGISVTGSGTGTVTKAGWIEAGDATSGSSQTKYISALTIPANISFNGVNISEGTIVDGAQKYTILYTTINNNSRIYVTGTGTNQGRVYIRSDLHYLYLGDSSNKYINIFNLGTANDYTGYISNLNVGASTATDRTARGYISTLNLKGYNTNSSYSDYINVLNIGTDTTNKNASVNTINNYGTIGVINLKDNSSINSLYGTGSATIVSGKTLSNLINSGTITDLSVDGKVTNLNVEGRISNIYGTGTVIVGPGQELNNFTLSTGTSEVRTKLKSLSILSQSDVESITLGGRIQGITGNGSLYKVSNAGNVEYISPSSTNGKVYITAYDDLTDNPNIGTSHTVVLGGRWVKTSLSASSDSGDYYGWISFTKPGNLTITTSLAEDGMSTYFDNGTSTDKNVTLTPKYTNTAGYKAATTTAINNGGTAYYKIKKGTLSSKNGSITGNNVTLGTTNNGIYVTGSGTGTVTKAGWIEVGDAAASTETKYINAITIPPSKRFGTSDNLTGVTLTEGTTSNKTMAHTISNDNTAIYANSLSESASSTSAQISMGGNFGVTYLGVLKDSNIYQMSTGISTTDNSVNISTFHLGASNNTRTKGHTIGTLILRGYNSSENDSKDTISTLKVGTDNNHTNAKISTISNYNLIENINNYSGASCTVNIGSPAANRGTLIIHDVDNFTTDWTWHADSAGNIWVE